MREIVTYPKQHTVTIDNDKFKAENSKDNPYGMLRISSSRRASRELSGTAYKLFVELALNKDGYTFALSPEALCNDLGISKGAYKSAKRELIERGYLYPEPSGERKKRLVFTPNPPTGDEPPKKKTKPKRSKNDIGQKMTHENEERPEDEQCPMMGQNMSCDRSENIPMVGQNMSYDGSENDPETIHESIYNTDSNNVSGVENVQCENDDSSLDKEDIEIGLACDFGDDIRAFKVRNKFNRLYHKKVSKANEPLLIRSILDTYLSTPRELEVHRLRRRKYGVWIRGWDSDKGEPIIYYPVSYLFDCEMKHENVTDIPEWYFREKYNEMHEKCTRGYRYKPDKNWSIQSNKYPKLEDTPNAPEGNDEMAAISEQHNDHQRNRVRHEYKKRYPFLWDDDFDDGDLPF